MRSDSSERAVRVNTCRRSRRRSTRLAHLNAADTGRNWPKLAETDPNMDEDESQNSKKRGRMESAFYPSSAAAENSLNCWSKYFCSPVTLPIRDQEFIAMKSASTHDQSEVSPSCAGGWLNGRVGDRVSGWVGM